MRFDVASVRRFYILEHRIGSEMSLIYLNFLKQFRTFNLHSPDTQITYGLHTMEVSGFVPTIVFTHFVYIPG